jgi:hypothetical protein
MSQTDTTQEAHVSIREGDTFRDELNNEAVEILNIEGDVATVRSGGAEWRERVRDLREKVVAGDMTPTSDDINISVESKADIPSPESAQLLYPDEATAREVADEMGLDGVHEHDLDGDTYWMPGGSHAAFEDATEQEGFADYESFEDCVRHNDEKDDPDAYCAAIKREVEGKATVDRPTDGEPRAVIYTPTIEDGTEADREAVAETVADELGAGVDVTAADGGIMVRADPETGSGVIEHPHPLLDVAESAAQNRLGKPAKSTLLAAGNATGMSVQPCFNLNERLDADTVAEVERLFAFVAGVEAVAYHNDQRFYLDTGTRRLNHAALDVAEILVRRMTASPDSPTVQSHSFKVLDEVEVDDAATTQAAVDQKAEFQIGEQIMWEYQDGTVHGVVREVVDGPVSLNNGAERAAPQDGELNYVIDEWDDVDGEYQRANVVKSGSELDESTADIPDSPINAEGVRLVPGGRNPVEQKAEFEEGAAVRWSWQGNPVHGRVAEVRPEQATVAGNTITGDEDESVYVIDEYDDRVEAYRRENVAKPESSLDESGKDLPPRSEGNYVNSEAWESVTTVVSESDFTAPELDQIAREHPDVLYQGARPTEWALVSEDPVVYQADIPDKYLADRDESLFVPNAGAAENARKVDDWKDEHGDDVAGGAPDGEGARRGNQLVEYHDRGEPLAVEYWEEILNYHERHRAQGNHKLDDEYQQTPWEDAGYVSNLNWGGDAGYQQAQRVMDHVESVDQELTVEMEGAVATEQSINRDTLTEADSNRVDLDALEGELREAVEADEFYVYGKASIEQWDSDDPPTHIQMDALERALGRFFQSETAPGIISRHHQDIPVGVPVESFEFETDTTLEIGDERYQFEAGDIATSHVEDADGDGRPELWLAANISNDNEMSKKTRVLAAQGDLDGFSVTVHRNEDEMTQEGRVVTDCDLHAVTIGHKSDIKNKGSQFDVASVSGKLRRVADVVRGIVTGD